MIQTLIYCKNKLKKCMIKTFNLELMPLIFSLFAQILTFKIKNDYYLIHFQFTKVIMGAKVLN